MPTSTQWQKSSYSGGGDDNHCLEIAAVDGAILVRESDEPEVIVTTSRRKFGRLIARIQSSEVDISCVVSESC